MIEIHKDLPLGVMDYQEFIENQYYIVDKTMMIKISFIIKEKLSNKIGNILPIREHTALY